jgi:hypothetical protein
MADSRKRARRMPGEEEQEHAGEEQEEQAAADDEYRQRVAPRPMRAEVGAHDAAALPPGVVRPRPRSDVYGFASALDLSGGPSLSQRLMQAEAPPQASRPFRGWRGVHSDRPSVMRRLARRLAETERVPMFPGAPTQQAAGAMDEEEAAAARQAAARQQQQQAAPPRLRRLEFAPRRFEAAADDSDDDDDSSSGSDSD